MKDLTGKIFDKLTVIEFSHRSGTSDRYRYFWKCKCECGSEVVRRSDGLTGRGIKSCGCYREEKLAENNFRINNPRKTHGLANTRLYKIHSKMKERCYSKKYPEYHLYGGRGIEICEEWKNNFIVFYDWAMSNGYNENLSIDRIEFDGNYEPNNCRWVDDYTQANNKRNNIVLTHDGKTMTLPEWARELKLPYSTLANRRRKGKSVEEILNPIKKR